MAAAYCTVEDLQAQGFEELKGADPALLLFLAEAASRIFDRAAEVPEGYFAAAAPFLPSWEAEKDYLLDFQISPNGRLLKATTPGKSGIVVPVWPDAAGEIVADGEVIWTDMGDLRTPRILYGDGTDFLRLPPYIPGSLGAVELTPGLPSIEFVERGGEFTLIKAYGTPENLSLTDPRLVAVFDGGSPYRFNDWRNRSIQGWPSGLPITVSARWGFYETPSDVRQATIQTAILAFRAVDLARVAAADMPQPSDDMPKLARMIADRWKDRAIRFDN